MGVQRLAALLLVSSCPGLDWAQNPLALLACLRDRIPCDQNINENLHYVLKNQRARSRIEHATILPLFQVFDYLLSSISVRRNWIIEHWQLNVNTSCLTEEPDLIRALVALGDGQKDRASAEVIVKSKQIPPVVGGGLST